MSPTADKAQGRGLQTPEREPPRWTRVKEGDDMWGAGNPGGGRQGQTGLRAAGVLSEPRGTGVTPDSYLRS